jgi:hypothetical protein
MAIYDLGPGSCYADYSVSAEQSFVLAQNTWVEIPGFVLGAANCYGLNGNALERLEGSGFCLVNGTSDIKVSNACQVKYGLFINGDLAPGAETPVDFPANNKIENIAITAIANFNKGDLITIRAWVDTPGVTLTISTLKTTYLGV